MEHGKKAMRSAADEAAKKFEDRKKEAFQKLNELDKFKTAQGVAGLTDEMMESLYSQAYILYNTGRYKDGLQVFRLLALLNPLEPKFIMGLAACFHMMKEYKSASSTYILVSILDPQNPIPCYHCSDCYIQTGDKLSAIAILESAIKRAGEKPEFAALKQRAIITMDALKKELQELAKSNPH
jgi:type III secretion system low calcium response chaperone LcrH/SycD